MVLFTIFCPIVAAALIMLGAPARKTALAASAVSFAAALFLFASLDRGHADFQHVASFSISPEWRLSFTTGVDGLSVIMVLLASIVTLAAVWFADTSGRYGKRRDVLEVGVIVIKRCKQKERRCKRQNRRGQRSLPCGRAKHN